MQQHKSTRGTITNQADHTIPQWAPVPKQRWVDNEHSVYTHVLNGSSHEEPFTGFVCHSLLSVHYQSQLPVYAAQQSTSERVG